MKRVTTAILMAAATAVAHAEFKTVNDLFNELTDNSRRSFAIGYVVGVHDATEQALHCSPIGITAGQISDLVLQWMRANPAERHRPGDVIVSHVLQQTWPCRQAPARKPGTNL